MRPAGSCFIRSRSGAEFTMVVKKSTVVMSHKRTWSLRRFVLKALEIAPNSDRLSSPAKSSSTSLTTLNVFVVVFLMLGSCATLTEEEQYERMDKLVVAGEKYRRDTSICRAAGGVMMITYKGFKSRRGPSLRDYNSARCVKW